MLRNSDAEDENSGSEDDNEEVEEEDKEEEAEEEDDDDEEEEEEEQSREGGISALERLESSGIEDGAEESDDDKFPEKPPTLLNELATLNRNASNFATLGEENENLWQKPSSKAKRVLSSNTLAALNAEAGRNADSPKRIKSSVMSIDNPPELSLGVSAMGQASQLPRQNMMRGDSPVMSSDDEELDKRLGEELERKARDEDDVDNSPVPLLTPPQSPLTIDTGTNAPFCEWPSNLVVDSALMTAVTDTRPLSPASLQKLEQAEEKRLANKEAKAFSPEASTLTPLLRSIYVGID